MSCSCNGTLEFQLERLNGIAQIRHVSGEWYYHLEDLNEVIVRTDTGDVHSRYVVKCIGRLYESPCHLCALSETGKGSLIRRQLCKKFIGCSHMGHYLDKITSIMEDL